MILTHAHYFPHPCIATSATLRSALLLCLLSLALPGSIIAGPAPPPEQPMAEQRIALTFDVEQGRVSGTSRIVIPAGLPLTLHTGPLRLTGSSLENADASPALLHPEDRTLTVAAAGHQRTLYLSWTLETAGQADQDNLVSPEGITLAGFWHPLADRDMLFSLEATLPKGFLGISEAEELENRQMDGATRMRSRFPHALRSIHFVAGPYQVQSRTLPGGVELSTWFFPEDADLAQGYLEQAAASIDKFSALIGPFPYRSFAIVANRLPTGYGMPTFTLLGQQVIRLPFIKATSLGHEIVHAWFGNSVRVADGSGNWSEGLTTYLADHSAAEAAGKGAAHRKQQILRYHAFVPDDNTATLAEFRDASDHGPASGATRAMGYDRGALLFHMLRRELGDPVFFRAIAAFFQEKQHQRASWQDIVTIFSRIAGRELRPFFNQWLERPDVPRLRVAELEVDTSQGQSDIRFTLIQDNETPFLLQVPLVIHSMQGAEQHSVIVRDKETQVQLQSATLPDLLVIDPDYDLLRGLDPAERRPTWAAFLGAGQRRVILPPPDKRASYQPLLEALEQQGCTLMEEEQVKNSDLDQGSFLFAGESPLSRSLFAGHRHPEEGFALDVRRNPLAEGQVMVLMSSSSAGESAALLRGLFHYGAYSFVHGQNGQAREKRFAPSSEGMETALLRKPRGVPVASTLDFAAIMERIAGQRAVFVGETHTDMAHHILQLQVIQALRQQGRPLAIGMEMFPRSAQPALDRFINGSSTEEEFIRESRFFQVWGYDYRLYRDILNYARRHRIPVVGLNLDKQITSQVFRDGHTDGLQAEQWKNAARERDLDLPGYRERLSEVHAMHGGNSPHDHDGTEGLQGFLQAQALWDETMAESVADYLLAHPEHTMVVLAGVGHVYRDSGIPPRLLRRIPGIEYSTLAAHNGLETGLETGRRLDYLFSLDPLELEPAPKLGVTLQEEEKGLRVEQISPHGKAGDSGLREGDFILRVAGQAVAHIEDIRLVLLDKKAGEGVRVDILRSADGADPADISLQVELSSMEGSTMLPPDHPK